MSAAEFLSATPVAQYYEGESKNEKEKARPGSVGIVQVRLDDETQSRIEQRLLAKFHVKKKNKEKEQQELSKQRKLAMDILTEEWFTTEKASAEARVYVIEKLLPALIIGMEKVLMEAEKRNVINPDKESNMEVIFGSVFNPINLLAQQLMRNNPKFSNFPEASPYARGLRAVAEKIKQQVFDAKNNKLLELKEQVEMQRKRLEEEDRQRNAEKNRRKQLMENQFQMWLIANSQQVPLLLVQNGLYSYLEISSHLAVDPENLVKYDEYLEPTEDSDTMLDKAEFIKLFDSLDTEGIGYLDRHRILHLFEKFWDQEASRNNELNNPRKWPVIELEELDDIFSSSYMDDDGISVRLSNTSTEGGDRASDIVVDPVSASPVTEASVEETPISEKLNSEPSTTVEDVSKEEVDDAANEKPKEGEREKPKEESSTTEIPNVAEAETKEETDDNVMKESEKVVDPNLTDESGAAATDTANDEAVATNAEQQEDIEKEGEEEPESKDVKDPPEETASEEVEVLVDEAVKEEVAEEMQASQEQDTAQVEETSQPVKPDEDTGTMDDTKRVVAENGDSLKSQLAKGLVLTTPVLTDDGDSGSAVKIQFSKSTPQERQVRKTTTYSVVTKGRVPDPVKPAGGDAPVEPGSPIQPDWDNLEEPVSQSAESTEATEEKYPTSPVMKTVADTDEASMSVHGKTRLSSTYQMSVAFAAEPVSLTDKRPQEFYSEFSSRSHSRMSVFDESQLNKPRFVSLMEAFISEEATHKVVENLLNFLFYGYVETEDEKMERIAKAHRAALSAKHRDMIENVFNKWDIDGRGYLEIDTIEEIMSKYKGGSEIAALKRGRIAIKQSRKQRFSDIKITKKEFHIYMNAVFDSVIEFVSTTVERTYTESIRGEARRKWLRQIQIAAETSGAIMSPVYRFIFQTLFKDAEAHGNQKRISAYIALLENNNLHPSRGDLLLRYAACTPDNAPFMLGKAFYEDMQGISFYCVRRGKVVHVPRVHSHGRIYFWNPERLIEPKEASLVLIPLKDDDHRVFGLLGIDNLGDIGDRSVFSTHELNFYQGVGKVFASAFHHVDLKRKLLCIIESAMSWIHSRAPTILNITIYFVEPDPKANSNHVLRKMMFANNTTGVTQRYGKPQRLYRKDNLFRDYLFKCMETSDTVTSEAYGEYHMAYPIRGNEGDCQCVVDISLGKLNELPRYEAMEMQRMLKLLQAANKEMLQESTGGKKNIVLEAEGRISDDTRVEIMFDRLMLTDLRENVKKLDKSVFAELHNYKIPPTMIHNIVKAVLMIFYQDEEEHEALEDWINCKQLTTAKLHQKIVDFDPTAKEAVTDEVVGKISNLLKGIAHGAVAKHGSIPAQQLYNWAFVCLSLIEHTRKSGDNSGQPAVTPVTSASTATTTDTQDSLKAASTQGL